MKDKPLFLISFLLFPIIIFSQNSINIIGGKMTLADGGHIVLKNTKWINGAQFDAGTGTVHFTGDAITGDASISGDSVTVFYHLKINKSSGDVQLMQTISIKSFLEFLNGSLQLEAFDVDMDENAAIAATPTAFVKTTGAGSLIQEVGNLPTMFPVGSTSCTPLILENTGTPDVFHVRAETNVLENGTSGNPLNSNVVNRTWHIEEDTPGGSDATITVSWYAADELTGFDRSQCYLSHYHNSAWDAGAPGPASGGGPYSISRSGINSFSPFGVGSSSALPVELVSFRAILFGEMSKLDWATASEINSGYFEIDHSVDGIYFRKIGEVKAAGNSTETQRYNFLHEQPMAGINYYRLKQVDLDGSFDYSNIASVNLINLENLSNLHIYPNPTAGFLFVEMPVEKDFNIELFNENGQLVLSKINTTQIDMSHLPAGEYFIKIKENGTAKMEVRKITVQR